MNGWFESAETDIFPVRAELTSVLRWLRLFVPAEIGSYSMSRVF